MTRARFDALTLPFLVVCIVTSALTLATYAMQASAAPAPSTEYAEYRNDRWHYSLAVPAYMTVSEYDREGGGETVQFMDASGDYEFQISAWPYSQLDVNLGRIGEPSGASDQPDQLEIVDVVRNDLFTVLFQKNGVRYAVVTLPEQEAWLTELLTTWQFTD
jgi:hypothetical protein